MSSVTYIDGRMVELQNCAHIIAMAQQHLNAAAASGQCGTAHVLRTNVDTSQATSTLDRTRMDEDVVIRNDADIQALTRAKKTIGIEDSSGTQSRLTRGGVYDPSSANWDATLGGEPIEPILITSEPLKGPGSRIAADLECGALDGARLVIVETVDEQNNRSYAISFEDILFDANRATKNPEHRRAIDAFKAAVMAGPPKLDGGEAAEVTGRLAASFRAAGLQPARTKRSRNGDTQVVFSNRQPARSEAPTVVTKTVKTEEN
jgi:hypothetical protein